ncbi:MAG: hypothetical protein K2O60_07925 [Ruminococcus sp.]|nr:hypothetical protein [Ruminococcus sp.]
MELNQLTKKLLAEGYTKENYPDYIEGYNEYYGGFTYKYEYKRQMVFQTQCGLFCKYDSAFDDMSYAGIDWTAENDCLICYCPYHTRKIKCCLNDENLEELSTGSHYENMHFCRLRMTDELYCKEHSVEHLEEINEETKKRKIEEFSEKHKGRICEMQIRYSHSTEEVSQIYDINACMEMGCTFCTLRNKEIFGKKVNIIYDTEIVSLEKGFGMIPDSEKISIVRNIKFTKHPIPETLAECILGVCRKEINDYLQMKYHTDLFFKRIKSVRALNVRAEKKLRHDIYEDLALIKEGITVSYSDVLEKEEKVRKSQKKSQNKQKRIDSLIKKYIQFGYDGLGEYKHRFDKMVDKGIIDFVEVATLREEFLKSQTEEQIQLSFFDDM